MGVYESTVSRTAINFVSTETMVAEGQFLFWHAELGVGLEPAMMLHAFGQSVAKQDDSLSVLYLQSMGCLRKKREDRRKEDDGVEDKKATTNFLRVGRRVGHIEGGLALVS